MGFSNSSSFQGFPFEPRASTLRLRRMATGCRAGSPLVPLPGMHSHCLDLERFEKPTNPTQKNKVAVSSTISRSGLRFSFFREQKEEPKKHVEIADTSFLSIAGASGRENAGFRLRASTRPRLLDAAFASRCVEMKSVLLELKKTSLFFYLLFPYVSFPFPLIFFQLK